MCRGAPSSTPPLSLPPSPPTGRRRTASGAALGHPQLSRRLPYCCRAERSKLLVLDVRDSDFPGGHLKGAHNIRECGPAAKAACTGTCCPAA